MPLWGSSQGRVKRLCWSCTHCHWCSFSPTPYFSLISVFPLFFFYVSCPLCPPETFCLPTIPLSLLCFLSLMPGVCLALSLLLQQQSLSSFGLPQSWLGLALGSPDFLESRPFLPSCPFSLSMKTKIFELEMAFKHLPRDGVLPGNPGIALSDFYHFFPKRKTFVSSPAG